MSEHCCNAERKINAHSLAVVSMVIWTDSDDFSAQH